LNRTKSLIWRRPSNAGDQYPNGQGVDLPHHTMQPQRALESISIADTASELWGSHSSIVEMTEFEMKELSRHNRREPDECAENDNQDQDNEYYSKRVSNRHGASGTNTESQQPEVVPSLPPRNADQYSHPQKQGRGTQTQMQLSPGSSSTNSFGTSNLSMPLKEADSCLVVSDHTRHKKSTHHPTDYGSSYRSNNGPVKRSTKENDIDMIQSSQSRNKRCPQPLEMSTMDGNKSKATKASTSNKGVSRVESFAVSEAPIIPENSRSNEVAKFSKRSIASGSVALSSRTPRSRINHDSLNQQSNDEGASSNPRGRRRLWENHANISDHSDNVDEPEIEDDDDEDDDEGTIDFNCNDEYDDEASSSVFIEPENEEANKKSLRGGVPPKEPKSIISSSSSSKRSKASDLRHGGSESRRSRSASIKSYGVDTVDLPKRHGGFVKEKSRHPTMTKVDKTEFQSSSMRSISSPPRSLITVQEDSTPNPGASVVNSPTNPAQMKLSSSRGLTYKGRPIGSPPPIPAPLPQHNKAQQAPPLTAPPPPPPHQSSSSSKQTAECSVGEMTEAEPDYGTIKGSPTPPRKEVMKVVPYNGKHQSLIIREDGRKGPRGKWRGSIRSEIHTVELITTDVRGDKPGFDYGSYIHRRLYYPDRGSRLDQKSERSGNYCGPWYDLWGEDPSVSVG
ncbi:hypothetical protein Ocin01_14314, partial [Orchesella cincta]